MKLIKAFILLAVLLAFAGSTYSQTDTNSTKTKKKTSSTKKVYKSYKGCKQSSGECTYFRLTYKLLRSGRINNIINNAVKDSLLSAANIFEDMKASNFKDAAFNFIAEYDSSLKEQTNGASWYAEINGKPDFNGKNVVSYSISQATYTGGAHPNSYLAYYNYDKKTGNAITLSTIFGTGWEAALNKVIDADFRKMKGLSATDNLQEKAYLYDNKITYSNNFALEKKGIRFYYNSYDIAPYSTGPTDLFVPWEDLKGIMPDPSYYTK
jgi:hypothetical protein